MVSPFPNPVTGNYDVFTGTRTSSERIGYAMDVSAMKVGGAKGGLNYDLFNSAFATYYGNVDAYLGQRLQIGVDYDYFRPTFDGDSIFNYFNHSPLTTITGRLGAEVSDAVDFSLSGGIRKFTTQGDPDTWTTDTSRADSERDDVSITDKLGNFSGRYRYPTGVVGVHGLIETGDRGHREGGDLYGEHRWMGGRWKATRASLALRLRRRDSARSIGHLVWLRARRRVSAEQRGGSDARVGARHEPARGPALPRLGAPQLDGEPMSGRLLVFVCLAGSGGRVSAACRGGRHPLSGACMLSPTTSRFRPTGSRRDR